MADKTYKDLFGDGYTTYHEDGSKSHTYKNLFDDGTTTYHDNGSKSHTYNNLFDDGATTYHDDGSKSYTYKNIFSDGSTTYHDDGSKSYTYNNLFDGGTTTYHSPGYGSSGGYSSSGGYGGGGYSGGGYGGTYGGYHGGGSTYVDPTIKKYCDNLSKKTKPFFILSWLLFLGMIYLIIRPIINAGGIRYLKTVVGDMSIFKITALSLIACAVLTLTTGLVNGRISMILSYIWVMFMLGLVVFIKCNTGDRPDVLSVINSKGFIIYTVFCVVIMWIATKAGDNIYHKKFYPKFVWIKLPEKKSEVVYTVLSMFAVIYGMYLILHPDKVKSITHSLKYMNRNVALLLCVLAVAGFIAALVIGMKNEKMPWVIGAFAILQELGTVAMLCEFSSRYIGGVLLLICIADAIIVCIMFNNVISGTAFGIMSITTVSYFVQIILLSPDKGLLTNQSDIVKYLICVLPFCFIAYLAVNSLLNNHVAVRLRG